MPDPTDKTALAGARLLAESGVFGLVEVGPGGRIVDRVGVIAEELPVGDVATDAIPFLLGLEEELESAAERGEAVHLPNCNWPGPDGSTRFFSLYALPNPGGGATLFLQDTTEGSQLQRQSMQQRNDLELARRDLERTNRLLRDSEAELRVAMERAEDATRAKSRFLAMMSHEIRTPMNGVLGMLELLLEGELAKEPKSFALTAFQSAQMLLQIIDDILDFSKIEAGRLEIERVPFDVRELVDGAVALMSPRARQKGLALESEVAGEVPTALIGDPGRWRQILLNLVGNALKFTECGGVTVRVHRTGDVLRCEVADTGIGISREAQSRLFDEFTQSDASTTRRYGGTGLGLSICKRLVELMDGQIGVESAEGRGSSFWFEVPLAAAREEDLAPAAKAQAARSPARKVLRGVRILVADDGAANRAVATAMLERAGCVVEAVSNGREAVEAVRKGDYDLVLMDIEMPELDGFAATRALRESGSAVPVIALTASAPLDLDEDFREAGFDDHVMKPMRKEMLLDAVSRELRGQPAGAAVAPLFDLSADVLDLQTLEGFGEDVGLDAFPTLLDTFLGEMRSWIEALPAEVAAGDLDVVRRTAHNVKSCAGTLGAANLRGAAEALEQAARDGEPTGVARCASAVEDAATPALRAIESFRASM